MFGGTNLDQSFLHDLSIEYKYVYHFHPFQNWNPNSNPNTTIFQNLDSFNSPNSRQYQYHTPSINPTPYPNALHNQC